MTIMILVPIYKAMDAASVISLVDFHQLLVEDGHKCKFVFVNGFNAVKARRLLTEHCAKKEHEADYVLWLDSDHVYKKEHLYSLLERMKKENLSMLSATYKLHGSSETVHGITENGIFRHFKDEELKEELIDCTVVGFGFLVMTHKFIQDLYEKYGDQLFVFDATTNMTEDVKFCSCVKEFGHRVCFDPKVKVGHIELAVRY
jgi:choline kinase